MSQIFLLNPRDWYLEIASSPGPTQILSRSRGEKSIGDEANLETLQFWQVGLYLEAGSKIDEPVPFQFPFDSLIGVYMYMYMYM